MTTDTTATDLATTDTQKELLSYIVRVETLEEEKKTISDDIKDVYGEAKGRGYDTGVMKQIVARRKKERDELEAQDELLTIYEDAIAKAA